VLRSVKRALAVTALLSVSSSWALGWSVAFHLASDDHHDDDSSHHDAALGLEMALHGHRHAQETPAHEHPGVSSVAAQVPGRLLLLIGTMVGNAPEVVFAEMPGRQLLSEAGPTHDPPPRLSAVSVLRI
jgi:hypothetical protein